MPPLIVHNVPEDERYVGEDGIKRPYAMVYPLPEGASKLKKNAPETGSFGKSSSRARSRSKTGTPAKKEDPTILAGDAVFADYFQKQAKSPERKPSTTKPPALNPLTNKDGSTNSNKERHTQNSPTEVILRGYKSSHQYAAIKTYELIAGRICEDYPRDPPVEQRRFKSDVREQAAIRPRRLTPEERIKASMFAGGEHWIKVTFESVEAADRAVESSPQVILGHLVYAELYRGVPPRVDEAFSEDAPRDADSAFGSPIKSRPGFASTTPKRRRGFTSSSPSDSQTSSHTLDTATLSTATLSSGTVTGIPDDSPSIFNPPRPNNPSRSSTSQASSETLQGDSFPAGIKQVKLLPASQALLPRPSPFKKFLSQLPLGSWLSHDIIGSQVPRTEIGDFDWRNASFYWKLVYLLDKWLNFQNGDVYGRDTEYDLKDE